jgi:hypothetical protein
MFITRTKEEIVIDITAEEFAKIGSDVVLKFLNIGSFSDAVEIKENVFDNSVELSIKESVAQDIAKGATALNKAIEGRYGLSSAYGFRG